MGQIATLHPPLSPMLWTSIATGKRPFKHGIHGFSEPTPDGRGVQPVTNLSRKSKAVWNILNQNGLRSVVIGWWPSHPAEPIDGVMVSDHYHRAQPAARSRAGRCSRTRFIRPNLAETLADLRMHPDLLTPEMVEPFIPLAREIDQDKDKRLAGFMRTLCECVSIHSAATWLLDNQPLGFLRRLLRRHRPFLPRLHEVPSAAAERGSASAISSCTATWSRWHTSFTTRCWGRCCRRRARM